MIKIYGKNAVKEAINNHAKLLEVYVDKNDFKLQDYLNKQNIKFSLKTKIELEKTFGPNHQGIGALREDYKKYDLEYFLTPEENKRVLILDGINDPHNLGAIIRSVDAFGFKGIILGNNRSVPITPTVVHVSTGAIEYVPLCYVNSLNNAIKVLKENNYWIVSAEAFGNVDVKDISKDRNIALVIGSEGFGITKTILKESDYIVSIAMRGHVNSLNASVSAGILMEQFK